MYATNTIITPDIARQHRMWLGLPGDWTPNAITHGAIKIGSRWQPISARIVARAGGYFSHWAEITVVEARGYPTMKAAARAARRILEAA